jgi:hypothetical protein
VKTPDEAANSPLAVPNPRSKPLIDILATMPSEAFSYVVLACVTVVNANVGNGGFLPASHQSFIALGHAINAYIGSDYVKVPKA